MNKVLADKKDCLIVKTGEALLPLRIGLSVMAAFE
jgi:hypothetical protein